MRYFRLSLLIVVACLLSTIPFALAGCKGGISYEQREYYLQMAQEYETKASEQQELADEFWKSLPEAYQDNEGYKTWLKVCERHDELAEDYRQQAIHYSTLAAQ
jgi:hypothetical protein